MFEKSKNLFSLNFHYLSARSYRVEAVFAVVRPHLRDPVISTGFIFHEFRSVERSAQN